MLVTERDLSRVPMLGWWSFRRRMLWAHLSGFTRQAICTAECTQTIERCHSLLQGRFDQCWLLKLGRFTSAKNVSCAKVRHEPGPLYFATTNAIRRNAHCSYDSTLVSTAAAVYGSDVSFRHADFNPGTCAHSCVSVTLFGCPGSMRNCSPAAATFSAKVRSFSLVKSFDPGCPTHGLGDGLLGSWCSSNHCPS